MEKLSYRQQTLIDMCVLAKQYFKDINLEKHCKTMSKWMVIVKLWENGDKLGKIKFSMFVSLSPFIYS
jgi:hypothetical protein